MKHYMYKNIKKGNTFKITRECLNLIKLNELTECVVQALLIRFS